MRRNDRRELRGMRRMPEESFELPEDYDGDEGCSPALFNEGGDEIPMSDEEGE